MSEVIGYASGVFDMFHIGHLNVLRNARQRCDRLIAGVLTDELTEFKKGKFPVVPFDERLAVVSAIVHVDEAVPEDRLEKIDMWERLRFDVIFKGSDWVGTDRAAKMEKDLAAVGAEVVYLPYTEQTSSTMLRRFLTREIEGLG